jgi:hypothetical protein
LNLSAFSFEATVARDGAKQRWGLNENQASVWSEIGNPRMDKLPQRLAAIVDHAARDGCALTQRPVIALPGRALRCLRLENATRSDFKIDFLSPSKVSDSVDTSVNL